MESSKKLELIEEYLSNLYAIWPKDNVTIIEVFGLCYNTISGTRSFVKFGLFNQDNNYSTGLLVEEGLFENIVLHKEDFIIHAYDEEDDAIIVLRSNEEDLLDGYSPIYASITRRCCICNFNKLTVTQQFIKDMLSWKNSIINGTQNMA